MVQAAQHRDGLLCAWDFYSALPPTARMASGGKWSPRPAEILPAALTWQQEVERLSEVHEPCVVLMTNAILVIL